MEFATMDFDLARTRAVLCLGAHPDDIEIGCGGTLLSILAAQPEIAMTWVVFSGSETRRREAEASFLAWTGKAANCQLRVLDFPDTLFPWQGVEIKRAMHQLADTIQPELIFTHRREDLHQDHRAINEITWNTFRQNLILEYEIPKYEGDLGHPNLFFPLSSEVAEQKIALLLSEFPSQCPKPWFDAELFRGLMRIRGAESNSTTRFAEAFHARKVSVTMSPGN